MAKERIYPFAVASVRSMENRLLTKQKLMQMAEAKTAEEALKILADSDYGKTQVKDARDFEQMIQSNLEDAYQGVGKLIPAETFMNIFRFKNDYHNIKVLIKEEISKTSGKKYLLRGGTIPLEELRKNFRERNYMELPDIDAKAVEEAIAQFAKTRNGAYIDSILDKACFGTMRRVADQSGIAYISKYVTKLADVTNLKTLLRISVCNRTEEELLQNIVPGGELSADTLTRALRNDDPLTVLRETSYASLCVGNMEQGFTAFEKACDDYLMDYVKEARYKTLTPEPVAAYILAKENEAKCVRIIMTCKLRDIDPEIIKERVREAYV